MRFLCCVTGLTGYGAQPVPKAYGAPEGWKGLKVEFRDDFGRAQTIIRVPEGTDFYGTGDQARLLLRPGAAVPIVKPAQHTGAIRLADLTLVANPDTSGRAVVTFYEDAAMASGIKTATIASPVTPSPSRTASPRSPPRFWRANVPRRCARSPSGLPSDPLQTT